MKETILLKQITPMWHFEPDINGCCLRASEVKPKLDRFLLSREKDKLEKYKIGKTDALDYKLSFDVEYKEGDKKKENIKNTISFEKCNLFFGNIKSTNPKKLIYYDGPITMIIFTLHENIIGLIKKYLCEFFATNSFGTRQDKGFGYFFPQDENFINNWGGGKGFDDYYGADYKFTFSLPKEQPEKKERTNVGCNNNILCAKFQELGFSNNLEKEENRESIKTKNNFEYIFRHIEYFHKIIRSGINENGTYYKSFMYFYVKSLNGNMQWDKASIRHHFQLYHPVYLAICGKCKYDKYKHRKEMDEEYSNTNECKYLFRDALGLSSVQYWKSYSFKDRKGKIKGDTIFIKDDRTRNKYEDKFTRFKSPINYRPCLCKGKVIVYIYLDESGMRKLKSREFSISHSSSDLPGNRILPMRGMKVPDFFSLSDYFNYIEKNNKKLISKTEKKSGEIVKIINDIFSDFRGLKKHYI